ncbi:helix-turn-helix domain-containing protein [Algoriphagus aquimarinus]|uniref:Helix-turn-helix transcriptional regulator n=1 Tax=Algoriphagus aquimarinus TaxID=237018 RepID=A0A5C7AY15_9BACT|nr:helix-turn-helix transcriptional regulator [Algoriphagus aquimarinus]TXE11405.1 helix-turn-helix transcriptional regulator [Algoriphagus aquimarinus]
MDIKQSFGLRIQGLRKVRGMSQEKLASFSELDRSYISGIEQGKRNVSLEVIEKLAKALEIHIKELFEE